LQQLGRYQLLDKLGAGAMGTVWRATDTVLGREVAIKVMGTDAHTRARHPDLDQRFLQEARAAALLNHPNVVFIYDIGQQGDQPFIVMEYLPGCDLQDVLARQKRLGLGRKVSVALQVARALQHAHSRGVIHRDVKPANIRVMRGYRVKLVDFGLAKLTARDITRMTLQGSLVGSVKYMAPERVQGEGPVAASDVFAFGILLYELLTGLYPFDGPTVVDILYRIVSAQPPPLPDSVPEALRTLVGGCLEKSVARRYEGFEPILRELQRLRRQLREAPETPAPAVPAAPAAAASRRAAPASVPAPVDPRQSARTSHAALQALLSMKTILPEDADIDALLAPLSEDAVSLTGR
jgi:eukaryotic-like serine/threonine-protein kinase